MGVAVDAAVDAGLAGADDGVSVDVLGVADVAVKDVDVVSDDVIVDVAVAVADAGVDAAMCFTLSYSSLILVLRRRDSLAHINMDGSMTCAGWTARASAQHRMQAQRMNE